MGIYEGLRELKSKGVKFEILHLDDSFNSFRGFLWVNPYKIGLNPRCDFDERAKTVIHEALHLSKKYISFLGEVRVFDHSLELAIEKDVNLVWNNQPVLRDYLRFIVRRGEWAGFPDIKEYIQMRKMERDKSERIKADDSKQLNFSW